MWNSPGPATALAERNASVVRQAIEEIWNHGHLELADALFTADYENSGGLIPDVLRGPEAIKTAVALHHAAFPELHVTLESMVADEDMVACRWRARDRRVADTGPLPIGENPPSLNGATFCRVVQGRIAESWMTWDGSDALRRLTSHSSGSDSLSRAPSR